MTTLYKKRKDGKLTKWQIAEEHEGYTVTWYTVEGGEAQEVYHEVFENNSGRLIEEQIELEVVSRIAKQRDRGYKDTREEALNSNTNAIGLPRPMLATTVTEKIAATLSIVTVQYKFNGVRCLATRKDGEIILYTRGGSLHVESLHDLFVPNLSWIHEEEVIDGEFYIHGEKLQTISSTVRKNGHPRQSKLSYIIYDKISNASHKDRFDSICHVRHGGNIMFATTRRICYDEVTYYLETAMNLGYEGIMLRPDDAPYTPGVRGRSLLRIKPFKTDEYVVTNIFLSPQGVPTAKCLTKKGISFDCVVPGNTSAKADAWINKERYVGRKLTIKYTELSKDEVPCPTVAEAWRERGV
jgi:hypothetical protein